MRLFILSDSPPDKDIQWSERGIEAAFKFLQKLWNLHCKIMEQNFNKNNKNENDQNINFFTNSIIEKITKNLENFNYNVIVANLHEIYNYFNEQLKTNLDKKNLINNYAKILKIISPVIPHFSYECLEQLNLGNKFTWPEVDKEILSNKEYTIVIQINGKKRDLISTKTEMDQDEILKKIHKNEKVSKFLKNTKIKKVVYVKNRLINLII